MRVSAASPKAEAGTMAAAMLTYILPGTCGRSGISLVFEGVSRSPEVILTLIKEGVQARRGGLRRGSGIVRF
jgi:hypothetical protein